MPTNPTKERNPISFRLRKRITDKLTALAEATSRSETFLAEAALDHYCTLLKSPLRHAELVEASPE
jgi:predicted transcriptional regulator